MTLTDFVQIPLEEFNQQNDKIVDVEKTIIDDEKSMDIVVLDEYNNDEIKTVERLSMETDIVPPEQKSSIMKQISYLLLIVGMLGISTGGVAFRMIPDQVAPILASLWRAEVTFVCLLPFLIVELLRMPRESLIKLSKDYKVWLMILYCGIASAMWTGTFAVALRFTSLTRVYLLNNSQPILLVLWHKVTGRQVTIFQTIGVGLGMIGLALTIYGSSGNFFEYSKTELIGDSIAFCGAIFAAIYINGGTLIRARVPGTFTFVVPMWFVSATLFASGTLVIEGTSPADFLGWMNKEMYPIVLWLALVTGVIGITVLILVMKYLSPLTISIVLLCEPVAASVFGVLLGVEANPSIITWMGAIVVTFGVALVSMNCYRCRAPQSAKMDSVGVH